MVPPREQLATSTEEVGTVIRRTLLSVFQSTCSQHPGNASKCPRFVNTALPYTSDRPPSHPKVLGNFEVPLTILGQFGPPEHGIVTGSDIAPGAAMPKTAIHEHGNLEFGPSEVRPSWQVEVAAPAGEVGCPKERCEPALRGSVSCGADRGQHPAPVGIRMRRLGSLRRTAHHVVGRGGRTVPEPLAIPTNHRTFPCST